MKNAPPRQLGYDIIKSLAIYLVCIYHFGCINVDFLKSSSLSTYFNYFFIGLYSIGVPMFFMVNGALMLNRPLELKRMIYRMITIVVLIVIWGSITLLILALKFDDHYADVFAFLKALFTLKMERINHLWFLKAMLYLYLLFPLTKLFFDNASRMTLYYMTAVIFVFTFGDKIANQLINLGAWLIGFEPLVKKQIHFFNWLNPFNEPFAYSLVYFILGGLLHRDFSRGISKSWIFTVVFLLSLIGLFLFGVFKSHTGLKIYDTVWNGYDSVFTLLMSICLFLWSQSVKIDNKTISSVFKTIGDNTLGIYFIHFILGGWVAQSLAGTVTYFPFFVNLLQGLVILSASLLIALLLRSIPFVSKLVKL